MQIQPAIRSELRARVRASNEALRGIVPSALGEEGLQSLLRKDGEFQAAMTATPVPKSTLGPATGLHAASTFATVLVGPSALL